eukprot:941635-Karenia_brevis.AAC.1
MGHASNPDTKTTPMSTHLPLPPGLLPSTWTPSPSSCYFDQTQYLDAAFYNQSSSSSSFGNYAPYAASNVRPMLILLEFNRLLVRFDSEALPEENLWGKAIECEQGCR